MGAFTLFMKIILEEEPSYFRRGRFCMNNVFIVQLLA